MRGVYYSACSLCYKTTSVCTKKCLLMRDCSLFRRLLLPESTVLYFSCQICKSLFLSLLNSHQILADSHFSLEGFFFYFSFFGKISCCVLLPVSPSWEVLHKTWWLLNWARDCAAYLKKEDNFIFISSLYENKISLSN